MCLSLLTKTNTTITKGYKVFKVESGCIYPDCQFNAFSYPRYKWIEDTKKGKKLMAESYEFYPIGFHFFETLGDAIMWRNPYNKERIFKIKVQDVVASGVQLVYEYVSVHVATKMFIQEEVNP